MRINPINTFYKLYKPAFCSRAVMPESPQQKSKDIHTSVSKSYYSDIFTPHIVPKDLSELDEGQFVDTNGAIFNKHVTTFCRNDLNWSDFGEYLKENYQSPQDVNFKVFGCSTGDEAFSLALLLNKVYDTTDFNIDASDISNRIIEANILKQKVGILINPLEFFHVCTELDIFNNKDKYVYRYCGAYIVRPEISNTVQFRQANILKEIDNIDSQKPSVILCRNMWPYISSDKYSEFADKLYNKLPKGSLVVIGSYDYIGNFQNKDSNEFPNKLKHSGFIPINHGTNQYGENEIKDHFLIFKK